MVGGDVEGRDEVGDGLRSERLGWEVSVGRRMEGEGLCQRKAREWRHVRNERLGEVTERSRGKRDVCMRDQDGEQSDGTREREQCK